MNLFRALLILASLHALRLVAEAAAPAIDGRPSVQALFEPAVALRPELAGAHPRLFWAPQRLAEASLSYANDPHAWRGFLPSVRDSAALPIDFTRGLDRGQDSIARENSFRIAQLALAFAVTGEERYRHELLRWTPLLRGCQPLRYDEHNGDLVSGDVLLDLASAYDLVHGRIDASFDSALHYALTAEARNAFDSLLRKRAFPYEQNHFTIPVSGLAVASLALDDPRAEVARWRAFSIHLFERCLGVLSPDGWYFEGPSYWQFTTQYLVPAAAAVRQTTGEDLFARPPFSAMPLYLAHIILPDPRFVFDFSDWGPRTQPNGTAQPGYDVPWHTLPTHFNLAVLRLMEAERPDPLLAMVLDEEEKVTRSSASSGPLGDALLFTSSPAVARRSLPEPPRPPAAPPYHYFGNMDVVHWRTRWLDPDATAIAFKSGPPAGHDEARLIDRYPEWKPGLGHAHPDAGTFTIFAHGVFLANGGEGYTGKKTTADTNSLLVDGVGQEREGTAWGTFDRPYRDYDAIRLEDVSLSPRAMAATAVFTAAYPASLRLSEVRRRLVLMDGRYLLLHDAVKSDVAHRYTWLLHGDRRFAPAGANRFAMQNGPGRLMIQVLDSGTSASIEPTMVETELYDPHRSRPKQRGWHLALTSENPSADWDFVVAMAIQSSSQSADSFRATRRADGKVEIADDCGSCVISLVK